MSAGHVIDIPPTPKETREFLYFLVFLQQSGAMSGAHSHPNFPIGLDIAPLIHEGDEKGTFDADTQRRAIERFGIAGRIW